MQTPSIASVPSASIFANSTLKKRSLVIIDSSVADAEMLADGVIPGATVVLLQPDQDGVAQITQILQAHPSLTSLHIISHGEPGSLTLGNIRLCLHTLERYAWDLQSWFSSATQVLNPPSLLLYGCHIAEGEIGAEFLAKLHHLTGANLAASNTLTGNVALGGNWELEESIGPVDKTLAFKPAILSSYAATLAVINGKV